MKTTEPKLAEIAARINAHLKRFERDPKINICTYCDDRGKWRTTTDQMKGLATYYHASAWAAGSRVRLKYIVYQGGDTLTKVDALKYLAKLDAGFVGKHWDALRGDK